MRKGVYYSFSGDGEGNNMLVLGRWVIDEPTIREFDSVWAVVRRYGSSWEEARDAIRKGIECACFLRRGTRPRKGHNHNSIAETDEIDAGLHKRVLAGLKIMRADGENTMVRALLRGMESDWPAVIGRWRDGPHKIESCITNPFNADIELNKKHVPFGIVFYLFGAATA